MGANTIPSISKVTIPRMSSRLCDVICQIVRLNRIMPGSHIDRLCTQYLQWTILTFWIGLPKYSIFAMS